MLQGCVGILFDGILPMTPPISSLETQDFSDSVRGGEIGHMWMHVESHVRQKHKHLCYCYLFFVCIFKNRYL